MTNSVRAVNIDNTQIDIWLYFEYFIIATADWEIYETYIDHGVLIENILTGFCPENTDN